MKSNKKSFFYIYICRIYIAIISLFLIPMIIDLVGYEAYGLIGVFMVVQACLNILTAGVGGVLTRELIKSQSYKGDYKEALNLVSKVIKAFCIISFSIVVVGSYFSFNYSYHWIDSSLDNNLVVFSVFSMFLIVAIKYLQGPYRSILLSSEKHFIITSLDALYATLVQPVALLILFFVSKSIIVYFITQIVSVFIVTVLTIYFSNKEKNVTLLNLPDSKERKNKETKVKDILKFGFQLSSLSALWIIVSQSDKASLASVLSLTEFSFYSVAFSVTTVLTVLNAPVSQVLQPRLTKLIESKQYNNYSDIFIKSISAVSSIAIPLSIFMFFYSKDLIYIWSGDVFLSEKVSVYLPWLFFGSTFIVLSNFVFLLKYSTGDLKSHTLVYITFSFIVIPLNIYISSKFFGQGMAYLYLVSNSLFYIIWSTFVFNQYLRRGWLINFLLVLPAILISYIYFHFISSFEYFPEGRFNRFLYLASQGFICVLFIYSYFRFAVLKINFEYSGSKNEKS
ncbi:O10 family O-antigen flippase [Shewanella basaltis]|uniref:lipopolysaccharide biosynthesis protein n=1 Tax=Shewanella basaltis TaxID=472183 RepID=UPI00201050BB|nr:MATE family efflux transporter [Shewanella basaltis]MCL1112992.1 O10 family O-antigen flippase [Shewanella basaltis]